MPMKKYDTKYGILNGLNSVELYDNGMMKECAVVIKNVLNTPVGKLIPLYEEENVRNKYIKALAFYDNGLLRKIALQDQTSVETGIGLMKAELITFYESGKLKRVFPLNGKLSGYWTEESEYELTQPQELLFPFGKINRRIISLLFYESGSIKSVTFWPKEVIILKTPAGRIGVHYGISLYPDGSLKSCEPAYPLIIETPIGKLNAFDITAIGINGDKNSLNFNEDGSLSSVVTSTDVIEIYGENSGVIRIEPGLRPSMIEEDGMEILPLKIEFNESNIRINENDNTIFSIKDYHFKIINNTLNKPNRCSDCSDCNGCSV